MSPLRMPALITVCDTPSACLVRGWRHHGPPEGGGHPLGQWGMSPLHGRRFSLRDTPPVGGVSPQTAVCTTVTTPSQRSSHALGALLPSRHNSNLPFPERARAHGTGALRAALFGFCDGLVSNCCLVIGVFASLDPNDSQLASTLLITAIAGLTAGATSMAAGEWCVRPLSLPAAPDERRGVRTAAAFATGCEIRARRGVCCEFAERWNSTGGGGGRAGSP